MTLIDMLMWKEESPGNLNQHCHQVNRTENAWRHKAKYLPNTTRKSLYRKSLYLAKACNYIQVIELWKESKATLHTQENEVPRPQRDTCPPHAHWDQHWVRDTDLSPLSSQFSFLPEPHQEAPNRNGLKARREFSTWVYPTANYIIFIVKFVQAQFLLLEILN